MPKIELHREHFFKRAELSTEELEVLLPAAKAELDELSEDRIKIELNDTNRPDLWSSAGLLRLVRTFRGHAHPQYHFFYDLRNQNDNISSGSKKITRAKTVQVEAETEAVRPYLAGFIASGRAKKLVVDQVLLDEIILMQEKLCWNYGQKRSAVSMGVYRSDHIEFPIHYKAVDPESCSFVPLGFTEEMNLREIIAKHPKGQEFGHIVENSTRFPLLLDNRGHVLSFPPIINSADIGAVEIGDTELFVELTGTDLRSVLLATSIIACNFADEGFEIEAVLVQYPNTSSQSDILLKNCKNQLRTPCLFQESQSLEMSDLHKLLGTDLSTKEAKFALERLGSTVKISPSDSQRLIVSPPPYRNDYLHYVDIIEDVMIGMGMDYFKPQLPQDFTIGRLLPIEESIRSLRNTLLGLGYQEMIFNYLGSATDLVYKMDPNFLTIQNSRESDEELAERIVDPSIVQIDNPMTENFEYVRNSTLPFLLGAEASSGNAAYPHYIFECGKIARLDPKENYGSRSINSLGLLYADREANLNHILSHIASLFYYLKKEYSIVEIEDNRFIPGRSAQIVQGGESISIGVLGEIHPGILENWGIGVPTVCCEIDLDLLFGS